MSAKHEGTLPPPDPALLRGLAAVTEDPVGTRATDRLKYAHDASHYRKVPQAVVVPRSAAEVGALLRAATRDGWALTFRAGGTSLSGQAATAGVLVDVRRHFQAIDVLDGGLRVRVQPGATVRAVNARLARHGRKLGPDPASEIACTIGGVVANNSSGMACGTHANTYATLESLVLVLASGTVVDTALPDADERFRRAEPRLHAGLGELRDRVRANQDSVATIRRLFSLKNTMGYGVNSFLDFDEPVRILEHLVVGSEGTLAFVAEATFRTVTAPPHAATGLLVFPDLADAAASLPDLVASGFATVELLDATSLRVAQQNPAVDSAVAAVSVEQHAALLVELQTAGPEELAAARAAASGVLHQLPLTAAADLTTDPARRASLWHTRKGLYAAVAGNRPPRTTALLEDVAVPVGKLAQTCDGLTRLFAAHGYEGNVVFGHAKDGNLHFLLNESFEGPGLPGRYLAFTEEMVDLVLSAGGTLKAEHGTGRAMAPYVRRQYGDELYEVMLETKRLLDPDGVLNPGVLLDEDADAHVTDLKTAPTVEREVDRCVECGYCEPVGPSRDLTTTPRQRIVLRRELARALAEGDDELAREIADQYDYDAVDTCAVDGMCATACPVFIDTGDLTRRLRAERTATPAGRVEAAVWSAAARRWEATARIAGLALDAAGRLPVPLARGASGLARAVVGRQRIPGWSEDLPGGGRPRRGVEPEAADIVFFPACLNTMFAPEAGGIGASEAFATLCRRAGIRLMTPVGMGALCCGTPWKSKGIVDGIGAMRDRVVPALLRASDGGRRPVVVDSSSCAEGLGILLSSVAEVDIEVEDAISFADRVLLPLLPEPRRVGRVVVHPTCSTTRLRTTDALVRVAAACGDEVVVPHDWGCCGFAGDRGMLLPELTAAASAPEAAEVLTLDADAYVSANRTCELGLARATGKPYRHALELLEEFTR